MDAANVRPGFPRWVKALGIVMAALLLLGVIVMLASGGQHGPSRHRQASLGSPWTAVAVVSPVIGTR
jgi:hypothetical protein